MSAFVGQVAAALEAALGAAGLAGSSGSLIVGVSGGPDSLALLDCLAQLLPAERLVVAHLDHGMRPSAAAEAAQVAEAAAIRGLRYVGGRADVPALAHDAGLSLETAARAARYDFLAAVARAEGAAAVVVGHNADDQAETILMHLLRGAGAAGLRGMAAAAPLPGHADLWLLRPLLGIGRADIGAYCRDAGLEPAADASNLDPSFTRNRLRHELLPVLAAHAPHTAQRLREAGILLAAEDDLLSALEDDAWQTIARQAPASIALSRAAWREQPLALRRRLLRRAVAAVAAAPVELSFRSIEAARRLAEGQASGGRVALAGGVVMVVGYETLDFGRGPATTSDDWPQLTAGEAVSLPIPGAVALAGGWRLLAEPLPALDYDAIRANADPWTVTIALEWPQPLLVRPRLPGERIRPLGLGGTATLKKLMIDRKIPAAARARWPVVATAAQPVWLAGHVLDDRARVQPDSTTVVRLRLERG